MLRREFIIPLGGAAAAVLLIARLGWAFLDRLFGAAPLSGDANEDHGSRCCGHETQRR